MENMGVNQAILLYLVLTKEACLIEHVQVVAQWRFPMDYTDMRILARTSTATNRRLQEDEKLLMEETEV